MKGDTDTKKTDHNVPLSSSASIRHGAGIHREPSACLQFLDSVTLVDRQKD